MKLIELGLYRHYKGNQYEVIGFSKHSETLEDMIIYKALYGEYGTWVRPLSMWEEIIEIDNKKVKRFEYIGDITNPARENELLEALRTIESTISKCEKAFSKLSEGTSQHTLMRRRLDAFNIAVMLINEKRGDL